MKRKKTRNINRNKHRKQWVIHITKTFTDTTFGSKEESLKAATKLRNTIYEIFLKDTENPYEQENVNYLENKRPNKTYKYWRAVYVDRDGTRHQVHFSIEKYGFDGAKNLAIKRSTKGRRWNLYESYLFEDGQSTT